MHGLVLRVFANDCIFLCDCGLVYIIIQESVFPDGVVVREFPNGRKEVIKST